MEINPIASPNTRAAVFGALGYEGAPFPPALAAEDPPGAGLSPVPAPAGNSRGMRILRLWLRRIRGAVRGPAPHTRVEVLSAVEFLFHIIGGCGRDKMGPLRQLNFLSCITFPLERCYNSNSITINSVHHPHSWKIL